MASISRPGGFRGLAHFGEALAEPAHPDHRVARERVLDHGQWWLCGACGQQYFDAGDTLRLLLLDFGVDQARSQWDPVVVELTGAVVRVDPDFVATGCSATPGDGRCCYCDGQVPGVHQEAPTAPGLSGGRHTTPPALLARG